MARVLHLISSNERRGAEVFATELADHLRGAGHDVRVMAIAPSAAAKVLDTEVAGTKRSDPRGVMRALAAARWAEVVVSFGSTSLITGALVAHLAGRPFVYRNIGDPSVWGNTQFADLRIGAPVRSAAAIVALYPDARDTLVDRYRLDSSRVRVIPRGVPSGRFTPAGPDERRDARVLLGLDPDRSWICYLGALSPEKDPLLAVEVLRLLPDSVGLVMAGGGPLADDVAAAGDGLGDRLALLGPVDDVRDVLRAADLLVLTSRTEGFPGAVIEAGLSAVPTVATRVGGVPHVIDDHRSGRLVDPDDTVGFADAVVDALDHHAEFSDAAFAKCTAEYSMATVGAAWETLISSLTPSRDPDRPAVLQVVASPQRRGAEVFAEQLGHALADAGLRQTTVAVTRGARDAELDFAVLGRGRFRAGTIRTLCRLARRHDVVIAHGSSSLLPVAIAARVARRPFVYRNIGDPAHWGNVPLAGLRVGLALRRATVVVALSEPAREWIEHRYGIDRHRMVVIPNAVDGQRFTRVDPHDRLAARRRLELPDDADVVGFLGSLSPEKRPEWAIRAAAGRPGCRLIVAGDGQLRGELEALAADIAPGRVRFTGSLDQTREFYAAIDLLLIPSITEGMPAVAIEAGLTGVRVVATDVGAIREVVTTEVGTTVDPRSLDAFLAAVNAADLGQRVPPEVADDLHDRFGMERVAALWIGQVTTLAGKRTAS